MAQRIAFFGQADFGRDVLVRLIEAGHDVVGVYAPPDGGRPDPLASEAAERDLPLFRHKFFRRKGAAIPERVEEYRALGASLNVLAYVTAILPVEIVDGAENRSICFHPSLLPKFRGGAALAWQIIEGETESGVTVFQPDEGVDTGPIVVQKGGVPVRPTDTAATLYFDRLYPLGVEAMVEAVEAIDSGGARFEAQDESRASFQGLVGDTEARIDWSRDAASLDCFIRGCDPNPGAHTRLEGGDDEPVRLFGARLEADTADGPSGTVLGPDGDRLVLVAGGRRLSVGKVRIGSGKKVAAAESGLGEGCQLV